MGFHAGRCGYNVTVVMNTEESKLSPLRTRLIAFAVLVVIALVSILLIDHRAMQRMDEHEQEFSGRSQFAVPAHHHV